MNTLKTDLYLKQIELHRYCLPDANSPPHDPTHKSDTKKTCATECPLLTPKQREALNMVLEAESYLPAFAPVTVPQPINPSLIPLNEPDEKALVIVTGNSSLTFEVLTAVWAQGITPAYFLLVDCLGNTVDMAMVFGEFKPERLQKSLKETGLEEKVAHRRMIVPGLTAPLAEDFKKATGWEIEVGPICAVELPLFLGERWLFAESFPQETGT